MPPARPPQPRPPKPCGAGRPQLVPDWLVAGSGAVWLAGGTAMLTGRLMLVTVVVMVSLTDVPSSLMTVLRATCWPSTQTAKVAVLSPAALISCRRALWLLPASDAAALARLIVP